MQIEIWQWLVLGIALCVVEIFIPSFTSCGLASAPSVVALIAALFSHFTHGRIIYLGSRTGASRRRVVSLFQAAHAR